MTNYNLPTRIDLSRVILMQYAKAERLIGLIKLLQESAELTTLGLWKLINEVFDIDAPISEDDNLYYRELGLTLVSSLFGFEIPEFKESGISELERLEARRRFIKGSIYLIDSDGSVPEINQWLKIVIPDKTVYIDDKLDMTINCVVPSGLSSIDNIMLKYIPVPAGVTTLDAAMLIDRTFALERVSVVNEETTEIDTFNHSHFEKE